MVSLRWSGIARNADAIELEEPTGSPKVAPLTNLDKIKAAIEGLDREMVGVDGDDHKLKLAFDEVEKEYREKRDDIETRRSAINRKKRELQTCLINALKSCGIQATIPGPAVEQQEAQ